MLVERFDAFLFDLDGVVYLGDELRPGAHEALVPLRKTSKEVRTPSSRNSPEVRRSRNG